MDANTLTIKMDERTKADFLGLADHIGIDPEAALLEAINHWIAQNASIFQYASGADLLKQEND